MSMQFVCGAAEGCAGMVGMHGRCASRVIKEECLLSDSTRTPVLFFSFLFFFIFIDFFSECFTAIFFFCGRLRAARIDGRVALTLTAADEADIRNVPAPTRAPRCVGLVCVCVREREE